MEYIITHFCCSKKNKFQTIRAKNISTNFSHPHAFYTVFIVKWFVRYMAKLWFSSIFCAFVMRNAQRERELRRAGTWKRSKCNKIDYEFNVLQFCVAILKFDRIISHFSCHTFSGALHASENIPRSSPPLRILNRKWNRTEGMVNRICALRFASESSFSSDCIIVK